MIKLSWQSILLLVGILAIHILLSTSIPFSTDEAHYALYALKLDWSYFDHPPMVGYLTAILPLLHIEINEFTLRVFASLQMLIINILIYEISFNIYDVPSREKQHIATIALALFNLSVVVQVLWFAMIPELPLLLFSLLLISLLSNIKLQPTSKQWFMLGTLLGMAGLSKYTAIILPFILFIWLIKSRLLILWLKDYKFWLAVVWAVFLILPVIYWNYNHNWASFDYQINHVSSGAWNLKNIFISVIVLIVGYNPIVLIWGLLELFKLIASKNLSTNWLNQKAKNNKSLIIVFVVVNLLFMIYLAGHQRFLPHWVILLFVLLSPLAAKHLHDTFKTNKTIKKIIFLILILLSIIPSLAVYTLLAKQAMIANKYGIKVYEQILNWDNAAKITKKIANNNQIDTILVKNWTYASRVAWYAYPLKVQVLNNKFSQFYFWYGNAETTINNKEKLLLFLLTSDDNQQTIKQLPNFNCKINTRYLAKMNQMSFNQFNIYICIKNNT